MSARYRRIAFGAWQSTCSCVGTLRIPLSVFQQRFKLVSPCVKSNMRGPSVVPPAKEAPRTVVHVVAEGWASAEELGLASFMSAK